MKIIHISDLHLDRNFKKSIYNRAHYLIERICDEKFDHLIISGDITENAESTAFELARNLLKKFGLLDPGKTSVVIGNHDIFGGVHLAEDVLYFPAKCRKINYRKKVEEFEFYFRETFRNTITISKKSFFPFIKEFDEFVLVGINSIAKYSVLRNPFASKGEIDASIFQKIEQVLDHKSFNEKIRVAITHHHFSKDVSDSAVDSNSIWMAIETQTMKLKGKKRILKALKKLNIQLVLHGHIHETNEYTRKGIKFINAGGSILGKKPYELKINRANIRCGKFTNTIQTFHYDDYSNYEKNISPPMEFYKSAHLQNEICLN